MRSTSTTLTREAHRVDSRGSLLGLALFLPYRGTTEKSLHALVRKWRIDHVFRDDSLLVHAFFLLSRRLLLNLVPEATMLSLSFVLNSWKKYASRLKVKMEAMNYIQSLSSYLAHLIFPRFFSISCV